VLRRMLICGLIVLHESYMSEFYTMTLLTYLLISYMDLLCIEGNSV